MKAKYFKVHVKTKDKDRVLVLTNKSKELPEPGEELMFYYGGANRLVKVVRIEKKFSAVIYADEIDSN